MNALDSSDPSLYDVVTHTPGPAGRLPLQADWLINSPIGDVFGWTMDAAMGWSPDQLGRKEFLILSTQGGIRAPDGTPIALGYHTGHWEVGLLAQAASEEFKRLGAIPFAGFVSDLCDGRTQGTPGMMDSLAYRNDAATVLRCLIRSLPTRRGVLGIATCDKGLPAMMMALAAQASLPCVIASEREAIAAVKGLSDRPVKPGDIIVLIGAGPLGTGMEETYQLTAALRYLPEGKHIALITDARFSGVSTGACIGHVGPEALAGGPLGRVRDGDTIQIIVDRVNLVGRIDLVGGDDLLRTRAPNPDLRPSPDLSDDTRLWAALQNAGGGTWGGCVYDVDAIIGRLIESNRKDAKDAKA